jgi:hypothetical protein
MMNADFRAANAAKETLSLI